jgi:OOP family OmpA-OmpF porin
LVTQGIERSRLQARGYGETEPVADNGSAAGRERNRRVEFNVLN